MFLAHLKRERKRHNTLDIERGTHKAVHSCLQPVRPEGEDEQERLEGGDLRQSMVVARGRCHDLQLHMHMVMVPASSSTRPWLAFS